MSLTVVDTPGFGDNIDNSAAYAFAFAPHGPPGRLAANTARNLVRRSFDKILAYVEKQYDDILGEETRIKRNPKFHDNRVHALLYFITPTGHSLRELDIELMRRLAGRVNVIPVVGKADSLTPDELAAFKQRVMEDIAYYKIPIYNFPYEEDDDEESIEENLELRAMLPFAVVGSESGYAPRHDVPRGRAYPWGGVEGTRRTAGLFDLRPAR